ncbi:ABC transporter permease, partial [Pseudomonas aeruginosa]
FQPSVWIVALVIAMVNWVQIARVIYSETVALAARDFVAVERTLGASARRILFSHLLPHLLPTILVWATLGISTTVLLEATLSFLGVGVQPPTPRNDRVASSSTVVEMTRMVGSRCGSRWLNRMRRAQRDP